MENPEKQQPKTRIEKARDVILRAPEEIEEEFQRTRNSWLACLTNSVSVVETYLCSKKAEDELGTEKYNEIQEKLEILKQELDEFEQQYPDRDTIPPDEVKQKLLEMLDVLK